MAYDWTQAAVNIYWEMQKAPGNFIPHLKNQRVTNGIIKYNFIIEKRHFMWDVH